MENAEKRLTQARTAWKSGRMGNGQILVWKPFLIGFRLEFDGVAGGGITTRVKKYLLHKINLHSRLDSISVLFYSATVSENSKLPKIVSKVAMYFFLYLDGHFISMYHPLSFEDIT